MPRYLHTFSYTKDAVRGLMAKPENRLEAIRPLFEAAGGKLIDGYYAFGDIDGVIITEFPSNVDVAALAMAVGGSDAIASLNTTVLIEMDEAVAAAEKAGKLTGAYRPPGE
ncbi:MAG TPA: GYD family protein [Gammaproteobacteria bacterium]|jgi:uncharacterized protein with GYD domain|nr:GYD domain-containing protein [Arenicellales bacterium]HCY13616.1 GYD family protein [Gammaproteobacteria bacterium]